MTTAIIANLERLLNGPRDGELLRFSLGCEWLKAGSLVKAAQLFEDSLAKNPNQSAAWKLLGKARSEQGLIEEARQAYLQGIDIAHAKGDLQAEKEMRVFLRRLSQGRVGN